MKKNLCLLIYDLRSGGAEHVICQWSELLAEEFRVFMTVFDASSPAAYSHAGQFVCLDVPSNNKNLFTKVFTVLKRAWALKKFVKENKIDQVLSFCNECNLVNTVSGHKAKKVCSIRSASDLNSNPFVEIVVRSKKNQIIIQTQALKKTMGQRYGEKILKKLFVFGNPFNPEKIRAMAKEEPPVGIADVLENKKTVVSVASFKPQKNHAGLLRAFSLVAKEEKDAHLLLVGADSVGLYQKAYEMAQKSPFAHRIHFVGELKNPYSVLSRATLFVLPSLAEGIPNVLAEALICSTPSVACDCPTGPAELLLSDPEGARFDEKGLCEADFGLLTRPFPQAEPFEWENISQADQVFAGAVLSLLESEERLAEFRRRAEMGAARFDLEQYKADLVKLVSDFM